jgi:hypothetical protein
MNANPQEPSEPDPGVAASEPVEPESPRDRRRRLLAELREERGSDVLIAYVTSTRPELETPMAQDSLRFFFDHLPPERVGQLDLLIHSNGGESVVPWRLMTLLREYADKVHVLVPHRAFSAATLTALGADEIVMHPMGMLGPIDASIVNPFGPLDENTGQRLPVSGEDVAAYNALVTDDLGIRHEEELVQAFRILAEKVHPLTLGAVKRGSAQARMLGEKLIRLRSPEIDAGHLELLEQLTTKLYFHGHPINRGEAKGMGLPVADPAPTVEKALWDAYLAYEEDMEMLTPFDPIAVALSAGVEPPVSPAPPGSGGPPMIWVDLDPPLKITRVLVESEARTDAFEQDLRLSVARGPGGMYYGNAVGVRSGWVATP